MTEPAELRERLLAFALSLPEAHEAGPWGETVVKVTLPSAQDADPEPYREWVLESYRAVAPKRLVTAIDTASPPGSDT